MDDQFSIVFLDAFTNNPGDISFDEFSTLGHFYAYERTKLEEVAQRAANADVVIVNKFPINEQTLASMPNVRYICVAATGFNNIDIHSVKDRNIQVSNVKGYSSNSVAQHVFACLLSFLNRPSDYSEKVSKGAWAQCPDFCFYDHTIVELAGKTMGLMGFGNIGKKVAQIAHAFDMQIIANVRNQTQEKPTYVSFVDKETLFAQSDFISLHCPLTDETMEIINRKNLLTMKPTTVIINTGRGALVNERDLFFALDHNIIGGAILDVLTDEPPSMTNPLCTHPLCMVTPHQAWTSVEARKKLLKGIVTNILAWQNGEWINRVY